MTLNIKRKFFYAKLVLGYRIIFDTPKPANLRKYPVLFMFKTNFKCLLCLSHDRVINFLIPSNSLIPSRQIAFVQNPEIQEFLLF